MFLKNLLIKKITELNEYPIELMRSFSRIELLSTHKKGNEASL